MKTVHKAILYELTASFALGILSLNFLLMMEKLLKLSRLLSSVGASLKDMASIVLYVQPQLLIFTIPMSLLIAVLLTYGRLGMDGELTALRACGMSFKEISRPVFVLGTACFAAGLITSFWISPAGSLRLRQKVSDIIAKRAPEAIEEGVFNTAFKDMVIYVGEKPGRGSLKGIFAYDGRDKERPGVMYAKEGGITGEGDRGVSLGLRDGFIHIAEGPSSTLISFKGYRLSLPLAFGAPEKKLKELTPPALLRGAQGGDEGKRMLLELWRRLTLPSLCLILMFLGPPLSLISGRGGRLGGLTVGLSTFAVYYSLLVYGENLAMGGKIPLAAGALAPPALFLAAAFFAFRGASLR